MYTLTREPSGSLYGQLIDWGVENCTEALVVIRPTLPLSPTGEAVLEQLRGRGATLESSSTWPGTMLLDEEAKIARFRLDTEAGALLKRCASRLFAWEQPDLPEDLCFFWTRERPALTTISHEADAFLDLDDQELGALRRSAPGVASLLQPE